MDTSRIHHATETFARDLVALITQSVLEGPFPFYIAA